MKQPKILRNEVIVAGIGGMGVLITGQILSQAALHQYEHVAYVPSYGWARRGGLSQCSVIFSNNKIQSPLLYQSQTIITLDSSQFETFEPRVRPGGIIISEKTGLTAKKERDDYKLYVIPGLEVAVSMGSGMINNLIILGAYVSITEAVLPQLIESELNRRYKDTEKIFLRNRDAFRRGLELGKATK